MGLGFIGWIVIGIIVGALAKLIMPGRQVAESSSR